MALPAGSVTVPESVPPETCACSAAGKAIDAIKMIAAKQTDTSILPNL
jgi:hypothetical protein